MKNRLYLLSIFFLLALLPLLILRDFHPANELRYLSIADEALHDGHLFTFYYQGVPYADKPPLYLWIVMLGKVIFGKHLMWFLSLFSLFPALVILFTMNRWVRPLLDERSRLMAAWMLMTSTFFIGLAFFLRMDMLMSMFIILALYLFWRIYTNEGGTTAERILFPLCVFLALFTKGPVGLFVPLLSIIAFLAVRRQLRTFGRYWGWMTWTILIGGCAIWFLMVWIEGGTEYLNNLLFHQTIDRATGAFHHHNEALWYYLATMWGPLAPWSLLVVGVPVVALVRRLKLVTLEQFFLTTIVVTLVTLSLFKTKRAIYLAPTVPFFVYLAVLCLSRMRTAVWMKVTVALPALIWSGGLVAMLVLMWMPDFAFLRSGWCVAGAGLLSLSGLITLFLLPKATTLHTPVAVLAAGLLLTTGVGGLALPQLNVELGYGCLCREAMRLAGTTERQTFYTWNMYRPESMDIYFDVDIVRVSSDELISGQYADGLLMLPIRKLNRDAELEQYLAPKPQHRVGKYLIVELDGTPDPSQEPPR